MRQHVGDEPLLGPQADVDGMPGLGTEFRNGPWVERTRSPEVGRTLSGKTSFFGLLMR
jgi:hypothetical protein